MFKMFKLGAVCSAIALVVACGGGGGDAAAVGAQVGVLTDAQVQGVQYVTSSGVTGTTDADGRYNYNTGDTVTFKIGGVTLGEVQATGIVTPIQLASGNTTKLQNLLVVLQSLDADGDASNGISIPAAAATALTTSIDLSATLAQSALDAVQSAMTAGGISGHVKTAEDAEQHFIAQAPTLLASNVWVAKDENGKPAVVIYATADGYYLIGEEAGTEYGSITVTGVDGNGFSITSRQYNDNNGESGLSHSQPDERFAVNGDTLTVTDSIEVATLTKMDNDSTGIVGAWAFASETDASAPTKHGLFTFFSNGYFMFTDLVGETLSADIPENERCGTGGMELGKYTYNATTQVVTPSAQEYNTNGCVGLFEAEGSNNPTTHKFIVSSDGKTAIWQGSDGGDPWEVKLVRVSK